jgi:hypothetical protein
MLLIAAAIAASAPLAPHREPAVPAVQARATVRILSGARLHIGRENSRDGFIARNAVLRSGGLDQPARLIEFE